MQPFTITHRSFYMPKPKLHSLKNILVELYQDLQNYDIVHHLLKLPEASHKDQLRLKEALKLAVKRLSFSYEVEMLVK